jgi:alpha-1,2-mannosyltransferase
MRVPRIIARHEVQWRRVAVAAAVIILIGCAVRAFVRIHDGDFKIHWETGRRFLAGEFLYAQGHDFPYPPILGMLFAPAAALPMAIAKIVFYPLGVVALLILLATLRRLVGSGFRLGRGKAFWVMTLAVVLNFRFILRDQAELGFNTAIAAMIWLGIYLWRQNRDLLGGLSLGLAIAIKCTPAIFLAYFVWKRQWRIAVYAGLAALLFALTPALFQGPAFWTQHMQTWVINATHGITGSGSGFEANEIYRLTNLSLRPCLMGYVTRLPTIAIRAYEPLPLSFFNFSRPVATAIVNAILIGLAGLFMWWSRKPVRLRQDPRLLWEFAATGVLMLLFSPITWSQHCVGLLPACYLIAALLVVRDRLPVWVIALILFYAVFGAWLGRDLLGLHLSLALLRHHISTFSIVALFVVVLAGPRLQGLSSAGVERDDERLANEKPSHRESGPGPHPSSRRA